jgi:hypothetical protein
MKGGSLLIKHGGLVPLLEKHYPSHNWTAKIRNTPSKAQIYLFKVLQSIFPKEKVVFDWKRKDLRYSTTQRPIVLGILPSNPS